MPFKSKAQMKYMFANIPRLAKKWAKKYGITKRMPEKVSTRKRTGKK